MPGSQCEQKYMNRSGQRTKRTEEIPACARLCLKELKNKTGREGLSVSIGFTLPTFLEKHTSHLLMNPP